MAVQRACDMCKFYKPTVRRYGLATQVSRRHPVIREGKRNIVAETVRAGGLDLCPECWEATAGRNCRSGFDPRTAESRPVRGAAA